MSYSLLALSYSYQALEPHIDAQTMEIHHTKHHQAYINNLNAALESTPHASTPLDELMKFVGTLSPAVRNNGGGHWNHSFFWKILSPVACSLSASLSSAIESDLGGLEKCKELFSQAAITRFGSGWAWMIVQNGKLKISSTPNQDNPLMDIAEQKGTPILGLDVWEHAYYLKYQNKRADYINAFWSVVNWAKVSELFDAATKSK